MNKIIYILMFISLLSYGQEDDGINQNDIIKNIRVLDTQDSESFQKNVTKINNQITNYIKKKEDECSGNYSTIITNEKGEQVEQKKKLTRKEKNNCIYLLINFQIQITKQLYDYRKKVMLNTHKKQLETLDKLEKKSIINLENTARKYK